MRPTIWTLAGLIWSSYWAHENPVHWAFVVMFTIPFLVEKVK